MSAPKSSRPTETYCPNANELIWIDLDPFKGHEQGGRRPALVLTPRIYNSATGLCVICPISGREPRYGTDVAVPSGCNTAGIAMVNHIRSVSWKDRFSKLIGVAPTEFVADVRERLATLLDIR